MVPFLIHHFLEHSARSVPHKAAVVADGQEYSYARIDQAANEVAEYFECILPVTIRNVVLCLDNCIEYVIGYYGILKSGRVAVPLSPELATSTLQSVLDSISPYAVICSRNNVRIREFLARRGIRPPYIVSVGSGETPPHAGTPWSEVVHGRTAKSPETVIGRDDLASVIFTSGSTGHPKGVMLSHHNIVHNTGSICSYLDIREDDRQLVVLPFFYVMGKSLLNSHIAAGATLVLSSMAFPGRAVQTMAEQKVTAFSGVPPTYAALLHRSPFREYRDRLPHLRYCSQAGGHMSRHLKEEFLTVKPEHTDLVVMYGATEVAPRASYVPPARLREKIDSIGVPIPGVRMHVLGEDGGVLGPLEEGEIAVQGENVMQGYWKDPEATCRVLGEHGDRTGDYGFRDEEGFFHVTGRRDDLVKVRGNRVSTQEVEDLLISAAGCVECCVMPVPTEDGSFCLNALVVPQGPDCCEQTIRAACAGKAAAHLVPERILLVSELPKMGSGKVNRVACRKLIE